MILTAYRKWAACSRAPERSIHAPRRRMTNSSDMESVSEAHDPLLAGG